MQWRGYVNGVRCWGSGLPVLAALAGNARPTVSLLSEVDELQPYGCGGCFESGDAESEGKATAVCRENPLLRKPPARAGWKPPDLTYVREEALSWSSRERASPRSQEIEK